MLRKYLLLCLLLAGVLLPVTASGRGHSRYFKFLQDSIVRQQDSLTVADSLQTPAIDSVALRAHEDSVRIQRLYDSLDFVFWHQIDTTSLPYLDSAAVAYFDSLAQFLPDTHDIKRAVRRIRKEERDSIKAAKPRVLETYIVPDSLYYRRILVWTSDSKFNEMTETGLDTTANSNFYEYPMFRKDISGTYLGVAGSAALYHNWFRREEMPDAPMFTPYAGDTFTDETIPQFNTKTPYTELGYWGTPFAAKTREESNLKLLSTQNITPEFNFTLGYRRLGSRGILTSETTDHRTTYILGNYMGKRYFANFGTIRQRVERSENGGIHDSFWIRDTMVEAKSIQVNLSEASNMYKRRSYFIHQTLAVPVNFFRKDKDSLALGEGTMIHLGHSAEFTTYNKVYTDNIAADDTCGRGFYFNQFNLNETQSRDELAIRNFENKVFIKLQPYAPDAMLAKINAGVGYQILSTYGYDRDTYLSGRKFKSQHNIYVYGGASGQLRKYLAWNADADYYLAGARMFDFDINGKLRLSVYPLEQGIHLTGKIHTELRTPHPFEQQILMNHHAWENDFSKVSKTKVEAELTIPKWRLEASFGYALVANMLYYDTLSVIRQYDTPVSVMSAYLKKDFTIWHLHFDNQVLFQLTSAPDVLPLPKLTLNLRWYFDIDVVKEVMNAQIGINAIANTAWYAPSYAPDIGQFYNQNRETIGNVPYFDIFANFQWKQVSLFVKYANAFQGWPASDYFSAYHYIRPTSNLRIGILWPFTIW